LKTMGMSYQTHTITSGIRAVEGPYWSIIYCQCNDNAGEGVSPPAHGFPRSGADPFAGAGVLLPARDSTRVISKQ
jgi:hypothetical protein